MPNMLGSSDPVRWLPPTQILDVRCPETQESQEADMEGEFRMSVAESSALGILPTLAWAPCVNLLNYLSASRRYLLPLLPESGVKVTLQSRPDGVL